MKVRILSATVGIVLFIGVIIASLFYPFIWNFAVAFLAGMAVYEVINSTKCCKSKKVRNLSVVFGALICFLPLVGDYIFYLATAATVYTIVMFLICMKESEGVNVKHIGVAFMMTMIVSLSFLCIAMAKDFLGVKSAILMIAMAWMSDTFALFSGMLFGKHKLAPKISPKKTVEGAIGGFLMCIILSVVLCWVYAAKIASPAISINLVNLAIIAAVCSVVSMIGDLSFSVIKRYYKIKNFSKKQKKY